MSLRYRGNKDILEIVKNIDAFPKVPKEHVEPSQIGGTLSLFSRILIVILIFNEVSYFRQSKLIFKFQPDVDLDDKIKMNVDLVVAMPCIGLSGVDLVDETQQEIFSYGTLKRENTWWELTPEQQKYFDEINRINPFLREEYHSLADLIFRDVFHNPGYLFPKIPKERVKLSKPYDACRLHGSFIINKVAGVLHIISGETPLFGLSVENHWHNNGFKRVPYNFTHRIYELSFGDVPSQLIQPLEGDERYISKDATVVQYFIQVVPTEFKTMFSSLNYYQYSVKENFRGVDSNKNSYGMPGIYFKYDWSGLKVIVKQDRDSLIRFLIRLSSIISGIVVISGILNALIQRIHNEILRFLAPHVFKMSNFDPESPPDDTTPKRQSPITSSQSATFPAIITNDLIHNANSMNLNAIPVKTISR